MSLVWSTATGSVYDELTATLSFNNDDTNLVYIDWDDGESNKLSEANYQWVKTPDPSGSLTVKHTYTAANTFYPVVQTVTSEGFVSRYYSAVAASATDVTPHTIDTAVSGVTINDSTATAIMRVENRTVKSGIDNSIFNEGPKPIAVSIPPLISQTDIASVSNPKLEIEVLLAGGLYDSTGSTMGADIGRTYSYKKLELTITGSLNTGSALYTVLTPARTGVSGASVMEVLSMKYLNPRPSSDTYSNYDIYNKLKIFLVASGNDGNVYPITYVSAGSPYKKTDDLLRTSTLDFSQGRAAASNKSISYYRYDNGKAWFSPVDQWDISSVAINAGNTFTNATRVTSPLNSINYTYTPQPIMLNSSAAISSGSSVAFSDAANAYWFTSGNIGTTGNQATRTDQFAIDDFGRFYDQFHLVRDSVEPNSSATYISSLSGNKVQATIFQPSPWGIPANFTPYLRPQHLLSPNSWANGSGTASIIQSVNSASFTDHSGKANANAKSYMLFLTPKKTSKFFLNCSNYAQGLQYNATSSSNKRLGIGGIYYLKVQNSGTITQDCFWKPLEFEDTTKVTKEIRDTTNGKYSISGASFSKSGYISFDMPSDWDAISYQTICGGVYNNAGALSGIAPDTVWVFPTASTDISVTGSSIAATGTASGYGGCVKLNVNAASATALKAALGTGTVGSAQVGAWKYIFYCTSGSASGSAYWIASGASDGWDGDDNLNLHFGETGTVLAGNSPEITHPCNGVVRRINAYEVMDGAFKGTSGSTANTIIPVGLNYYNSGTSTYMNNTWNGAGEDSVALFDGSNGPDWDTEDLYALKIVFDGESATAETTGSTGAAPTINNIFAANESHTAIVKEVDDSAYSLNSLPLTSDIAYGRTGAFYKVITRKGKVFIAKTGIEMQEIGFSSVALGDETSATVSGTAVSSLYGYLHRVRRLYEDNVRVYWDHKQKDGTFVRLWGIITDVQENSAAGGPRSVTSYDFNMAVEDIALLDDSGEMMTNIFPLGGVQDERNFT